jgi:hypothetical protein
LTITPARLIVTANDASREFGTPNPPFSARFDGLQVTDTATRLGGAPAFTTAAGIDTKPGTYSIVPAGVTSPNYAISFVPGTLTVRDTTPPVVMVPADMTLEATSSSGATGTFVASARDAVDGVTIVTCTPATATTFAFGTTPVTCTSTDVHGNIGLATFTVTVRDTTPPAIASVAPSIASLWPPNRNMVAETISVSDTDAGDAAPVCKISGVTSNEPVSAAGDWVVNGNLTLNLRADRLGNGTGRIYTIAVECTDKSGNTSAKTTIVTVPHDQSK